MDSLVLNQKRFDIISELSKDNTKIDMISDDNHDVITQNTFFNQLTFANQSNLSKILDQEKIDTPNNNRESFENLLNFQNSFNLVHAEDQALKNRLKRSPDIFTNMRLSGKDQSSGLKKMPGSAENSNG